MSKVMIIIVLCGAFLLSVSHAAESKDQPLKAWDDWDDTTTWNPFDNYVYKEPTTWDEECVTGNSGSAVVLYIGIIVFFVIIIIKILYRFRKFISCSSSRNTARRNSPISFGWLTRPGATNVINRPSENVADEPPGYDAVAVGASGEKNGRMQRVKASVPETPPPTYDSDNPTKY